MDNTKKYHKAGWQTGNPRLYATNSQRAKQMRKEPTEAEYVFWNAVKGGKLGTKVKRQVTIGEYIADFLIPQYNIVIEIDGGIHLDPEQVEWDRKRDEWFKTQGYRVIRIKNEEVVEGLTPDPLSRSSLTLPATTPFRKQKPTASSISREGSEVEWVRERILEEVGVRKGNKKREIRNGN